MLRMRFRPPFNLLLWALVASPMSMAAGGSLDIAAQADSYVASYDKTANFGASKDLRLYADMVCPIFWFDLSSIPPNVAITSASFQFTFTNVGGDPELIPRFYLLSDLAVPFVESEVTYERASAAAPWAASGLKKGEDFDTIGESRFQADVPGRYSVPVAALVRGFRAAGKTGGGFHLRGSGLGSNFTGSVPSRETSDAAQRPVLHIEYSATAPQAAVTPERLIERPGAVDFDGSASALPTGSWQGLAYLWTLTEAPPGSGLTAGATLGTGATLRLDASVGGHYGLRLTVTATATGEKDSADTGVSVGVAARPRLHATPERIAQWKRLRDSGATEWTRFFTWVKTKPTYSDLVAGITRSYLLAYLMTNDSQYVDWAFARLAPSLYRNGSDRSGGLKTLLDIYSNDPHLAAYQGGALTAEVALLFDWGYPALSAAQKQDIIDWLNAANTYNNLQNSYRSTYMRNDGFIVFYGLAASVYATMGDNPQAPEQMKWMRDSWRELKQAMDVWGQGGAEAEGNAYATSVQAIIDAADVLESASGEKAFEEHPFFRQRLAYDAFATYPGTIGGPGSPIQYGWPGLMLEQASVGGDGRRGASWASVNLRQRGLSLTRHFPGAEETDLWNWVYRQPGMDQYLQTENCVADLFYWNPPAALSKPRRLSFYDKSLGYVYIRSDWDSPDATWIAFWAGPHLDTHQHLDQGSFAIFKRRDLAPKTGHYDTGDISGPHGLMYYTRTVSSNNLLIGDPKEIFRGFHSGKGCDAAGNGWKMPAFDKSGDLCAPNDGGQRTMHPFGLAVGTADVYHLFQDIFEVAKVVHFNDDGTNVTVVADLTNAYNNPRYSTPGNSPKVKRVYRRLVYSRAADVLVVGDTVESTDPSFEKKWLLHALDRFELKGEGKSVAPGETVFEGLRQARLVIDDKIPSDKNQVTFDMRKGYSSLLVNTVFPRSMRYRLVGGRDAAESIHEDIYANDSYNLNQGHFHRHIKDFWVKDYNEGVYPNHRSTNWPPESPAELAASVYVPIFIPGYGRWRLEVETQGQATDHFLNVLKPSLDPSEQPPQVTPIETDDIFGASFVAGGRPVYVSFAKNSLAAPIVSATPPGSLAIPALHVKVYPNPWRKDRHDNMPVTFEGLEGGVIVKIFTVSGHLVRKESTTAPRFDWNLRNAKDELVASGIYLYTIEGEAGQKVRGKFAIVR